MDKNYRPEIDGLRALAIIPVVFFHSGLKLFSGGFVGVDVFFVISGYLITRIIYKEISEQQFSLIKFYERRARRILPALIFVLFTSIILAWFFLDINSLNNFGKSLVGVSTFSSNFFFWINQGYFDETTDLIPLLHTWSLSVEEQFYIIFPILLIFISKVSKKNILITISVLIFFSLCLSIWAVNFKNTNSLSYRGAFFLLPTRAWELGIGSLIALKPYDNKFKFFERFKAREVLEIIGLVILFISVFSFSKNLPFPGVAALLPVIGTGLIIYFSNENTYVGKLLSNKILVSIGLISYSLYLWHQIIFTFWRVSHINSSSKINNTTTILLIIVIIFLSFITYRIIERPFRNKNFLTQKSTLILSIVALIIIGLLGLITIYASNQKEEFSAYQLSKNKYIYFQNFDERKFTENRLQYEHSNYNVVVMGSSRLMQLSSDIIKKSTLNLSVSGASVEDYVAFVPEAVNKFNPNIVLLGADPWLFNKYSGQNRWETVHKMYDYWCNKIQMKEIIDTSNFLQPKYQFNGNFFNMIYNHISLNKSISVDEREEKMAKKKNDGLCIYNQDYSNQSQLNIKKNFPSIINYSMDKYEISYKARKEYINLIQYLKNKGIKVVLVLSPYHPELFKKMKSEKRVFLSIEKDFREIAMEMNIQILGSYDVSLINSKLNYMDFYDGMHPKESCMRELYNKISQ